MGEMHTPGPWHSAPEWNVNTGKIRVCDAPTGEAVADVWGGNAEAHANARLVAAAPDLLEALQGILAITDRNHVAWEKAREAISKALRDQNG